MDFRRFSNKMLYFFQGMSETGSETIPFREGESFLVENSLQPTAGYVRLEMETRSELGAFRGFTNPIWIKSEHPGNRQLRINCMSW